MYAIHLLFTYKRKQSKDKRRCENYTRRRVTENCDGVLGGSGKGPVKVENSNRRRFLDLAIPTEIDRSLDPNPEFARAFSIFIHRIYGVHTRESAATAPRPPLTSGLERTNISGGDCVVLRCVSAGDSFNNEEWSDDLSNR